MGFDREHFRKGIFHWLVLGTAIHGQIDEALMKIWQQTMFPDIAERAVDLRMVDRPC